MMGDQSVINTGQRLGVGLLVAVVLVWSISGVGVGAAGPRGTPTPTTTATATSQQQGNGGGGGWLGGAMNVDIPSFDPVKNFKNLVKAVLNIPGWIFDKLSSMIFGVPAPGQYDTPSTWHSPENGLWPGIITFTQWMTGFAVLILTITGGLTFLHGDAYTRRQAWKRWGIALVMVLATWTLLPLLLHLADQASGALRPDSHEAFSTLGNAGKILSGLGVLVVFAVIEPIIVALGLVAVALERFLVYLGFALWPLAWALRSTNYGFARTIGETLVYLFGVAIVTKVGQALMARFLLELQWTGIDDAVVMLIVLTAGVAFMLIIFPKKMLDHANDAASVSLGMSGSRQEAGRYIEQSKKRVGQVQEKVNDWRTDESRSAVQTRLNDWADLSNSGSDGSSASPSGGSSGGESSSGATDADQSTGSSTSDGPVTRGPTSRDPDEPAASKRRSAERKQRDQARIDDLR